MVPDNGEATTVGGSAAHEAWVNGGGAADTGAAPVPAPVATPAPAPAATTLPSDATVAKPGETAGRIADVSSKWLSKHRDSDRASRATAAAGATGTTPAAPASQAAPAASAAAVAGAVKAGESAVAAASAAGATPAQAAAAGDQAAAEFLEAVGPDGKPFQIPLGVKIPIKRNGKTELVSIADAQKSTMMETDYRHKTAAVAQDRRALAAEQARIKAERDQVAADRKQYEDAQLDPDKWEQYQEHLKQLQTNPAYRENWEAGRHAVLDRAELNAFREGEQQAVVQSAAESVLQTINTLASEYPGADVASVQAEYGQALQRGEAELTEQSLRTFFKAEAQRATRYAGPLQKQLEALQATVDSLTKTREAETAATTHNDNTRRAIDRDRMGRFTAPSGGAAPDLTRDGPPKPFTSHELAARKKAWVDKGRGELTRGAQ